MLLLLLLLLLLGHSSNILKFIITLKLTLLIHNISLLYIFIVIIDDMEVETNHEYIQDILLGISFLIIGIIIITITITNNNNNYHYYHYHYNQ